MKTHQEINQLFEKSMDSAGSDPASSYAIAENLLSTCKQNNDLPGMAKSYLLLAYSGQFMGLMPRHSRMFILPFQFLKNLKIIKMKLLHTTH